MQAINCPRGSSPLGKGFKESWDLESALQHLEGSHQWPFSSLSGKNLLITKSCQDGDDTIGALQEEDSVIGLCSIRSPNPGKRWEREVILNIYFAVPPGSAAAGRSDLSTASAAAELVRTTRRWRTVRTGWLGYDSWRRSRHMAWEGLSNSVLKGHSEWALSKSGGEQTCCSLTDRHLHVVRNRLGGSHSPWNLDPKWRDNPEVRYGELIQGTSRTALLNAALPAPTCTVGVKAGATFQK